MWKLIAIIWGLMFAAILVYGAIDQWIVWTTPEQSYSNAQTVQTPSGDLRVETDGVLQFPGSPIDLIVHSKSDDARQFDGVHYFIRPLGADTPSAIGNAELHWTTGKNGLEARIANLFPVPPEANSPGKSYGQSFGIGKFEVIVEFRIKDRVVAKSGPLEIRFEVKRH